MSESFKNIAGQHITIHSTVTSQMMKRQGYLNEFLEFLDAAAGNPQGLVQPVHSPNRRSPRRIARAGGTQTRYRRFPGDAENLVEAGHAGGDDQPVCRRRRDHPRSAFSRSRPKLFQQTSRPVLPPVNLAETPIAIRADVWHQWASPRWVRINWWDHPGGRHFQSVSANRPDAREAIGGSAYC